SQITYRTSRETALGKSEAAKFDLGLTTTVHVSRPLPQRTRRVVYRAHLKEGSAKTAFVAGPTQSIRPIDAQTVEVGVRAIRPDAPPKLDAPDTPPTGDDSAPNGLIQSDDPLVVKLAEEVSRTEENPWKLAQAMERHVKR